MKQKILVVDDELAIRQLYQTVLTAEGYEVDLVENGFMGTFSSWSDHYDLIILDLNMPGMNGEETLAHLRMEKPNVPVLIASGFLTEEREESLYPYFPIECIHKPFKIDELLAMVKHCLENYRIAEKVTD